MNNLGLPRRATVFALALSSLLPLQAGAAPRETLDLVFATQRFQAVALAPDGGRIAWVETRPNADRTPSENAAIYERDVAGGQPRRITAGDGNALGNEHGPAWSPDGRQLAFLSDLARPGQLQLYAVAAEGGAPRRLTSLTGYVSKVGWSPDGRTIALVNIAESNARAGAVEAAERETGEIETKDKEARLVLVDAATGEARTVSPADTYVYEYDWSPDSRQIAAITAKGNGDNNWWIARLQVIDASSGAVRELFKPQTQIAVPRWSPDGGEIAVIQGLMSDAGSTGGDIWLVPAAGGPARNLTAGRRGSPSWLHWQPGSGRLLFTESVDGGRAIAEVDPASGRTSTLWQGDEDINCGVDCEMASLSVARDGSTCAMVRSSFAAPPEIWVGPVGKWEPITQANRGQSPLWGRAEKIRWTSDAFQVQGWLLYPRNFDPGRRYPLVVVVHGGPASQIIPSWPGTWPGIFAPLAAEGYFTFCPNPRGSFGHGEAFTEANKRDFCGGDWRDIMSGLDAVLKSAPVDPHRLGIGGWSYGGYMTMWALTQTNRFGAAVSGAGVANMQSYYGQNQIDEWMIPYFGASAYDDPAAYARCSPITFIRNVRTPTLIIAGERDKECPAPQSYEYWHALRALGVETTLVVYEGEGHHFRNPAHVEDLLTRSVDWFNARLR
jgi:dipeptidyl aminopeptidase/acylaminoacyl peptidase